MSKASAAINDENFARALGLAEAEADDFPNLAGVARGNLIMTRTAIHHARLNFESVMARLEALEAGKSASPIWTGGR